MELKQLQYFVTSVDLGSFKKAADALYTTQPHVSKTIKALEDELGLTLFDRHPVGVTITEAGKQVYTHASDILRRCGQIAQVEADGGCEPLHVAATPSGFLADLTAKFCRDRQALDLRYHEGSMEDILQKLHRHEADLGLVALTRRKLAGFGQIIDKKRLTLEVLCEDSPCLFVGQTIRCGRPVRSTQQPCAPCLSSSRPTVCLPSSHLRSSVRMQTAPDASRPIARFCRGD